MLTLSVSFLKKYYSSKRIHSYSTAISNAITFTWNAGLVETSFFMTERHSGDFTQKIVVSEGLPGAQICEKSSYSRPLYPLDPTQERSPRIKVVE